MPPAPPRWQWGGLGTPVPRLPWGGLTLSLQLLRIARGLVTSDPTHCGSGSSQAGVRVAPSRALALRTDTCYTSRRHPPPATERSHPSNRHGSTRSTRAHRRREPSARHLLLSPVRIADTAETGAPTSPATQWPLPPPDRRALDPPRSPAQPLQTALRLPAPDHRQIPSPRNVGRGLPRRAQTTSRGRRFSTLRKCHRLNP